MTATRATAASRSLASQAANEHTRRLRDRIEVANKYLEQRNYNVVQRNGQRISTHRTLQIDASVEGPREVFIGKLPRDLFEDELLPKMEKAGRVQNMRLMMDFSSSNRGFAFAKYVTPQEAQNACLKINDTQIRDDELPIGVLLSFDNRRLFMGNLPAKITKETLRKELDKVITGVADIQLSDCGPIKPDSRNAFVSFETHEAATQARRVLCPGDITVCDRTVTVDWAKPDLPGASQLPSSPPSSHIINYTSNNIERRAAPPKQGQRPSARQPLANRPHRINYPSQHHQRSSQHHQHQQQQNIPPPPSQPPQQHHHQQQQQQHHHQLLEPSLAPLAAIAPPKERMPLESLLGSSTGNGLVAPHYASQSPIHILPADSILGERARQMLAAPDPACTILVKNINRTKVDETKLKLILQLGDKLKVLAINPSGPDSIEVTYSEPRQALFMSNLLTEHSQSFERLALPERKIVVARPMAIMDLNANYYQSMPSTPDSSMSFYNQNNILARTVKGLLYNNETFNLSNCE